MAVARLSLQFFVADLPQNDECSVIELVSDHWFLA